MSTERQSNKSRRLLITAVLAGAGITAAAVLYQQQVSAPYRSETTARQAGPGASLLGEGSDGRSGVSVEQGTPGDPGSPFSVLSEPATAAADGNGEQQVSSSGGVSSRGGDSRQGSARRIEAGVQGTAETTDESDGLAGISAVPKSGSIPGASDQDAFAQDTSAGAGAGTSTQEVSEEAASERDNSETGSDSEEEAEPPPPPLQGTWTGRMEVGTATTADGQLNCAAGNLNNFRLLFNDAQNNYVLFGSVSTDAGSLGRIRGFRFAVRGEVGANGVFGNGESWALDKRAELGNYQVEMAGAFSPALGMGSWGDTLGCSGTWSLEKKQ